MSSGRSVISAPSLYGAELYCDFGATFSETEVNNEANTSKIKWSAWANYDSSNGYPFNGSTRDEAGTMLIYMKYGSNWTVVGSTTVPLDSGSYVGYRLRTYTGTSGAIPHNEDGTKTVLCEVDIREGTDPKGGGYVWSNVDGSTDTLTLTAIPRASKPTINTPTTSDNTFELGTTITIYTNRKLTGAKHTVVFKYNSTSVTVGTAKAVEDSVTYNTGNIAAAFLNANPNATQLTGTIEVTTFNSSGTQVGSVQSINYTATIPDSYGPTIAFPSDAITETALNNVGVAAKTIVRYISKKKFKVTVTPKNNATIVQVILKDGSNIRYLTQSGTTTTWTGEFTGLETNNISFQATDSRGKVSSLAMTGLTLVPYTKPTIQNAYLTRVNASTGTNSELTVYGAYYNGTIGSVTNTITVKYTLNSGSQQTIPANSVTYHDNVYNAVGIVGTLAPDTSYTANVIATDSFNQSISIDISLASVHDVLWLGKKTVRVHDYLIADQDVWLNDGDVKLSEFKRTFYEVKGQASGGNNPNYHTTIYQVVGSGFLMAHGTTAAATYATADYGTTAAWIDISKDNGATWQWLAHCEHRKHGEGYMEKNPAADVFDIIPVGNGDRIRFFSNSSTDAYMWYRHNIMAFGCTVNKIYDSNSKNV